MGESALESLNVLLKEVCSREPTPKYLQMLIKVKFKIWLILYKMKWKGKRKLYFRISNNTFNSLINTLIIIIIIVKCFNRIFTLKIIRKIDYCYKCGNPCFFLNFWCTPWNSNDFYSTSLEFSIEVSFFSELVNI